jgi:hypothetical protein
MLNSRFRSRLASSVVPLTTIVNNHLGIKRSSVGSSGVSLRESWDFFCFLLGFGGSTGAFFSLIEGRERETRLLLRMLTHF